MNQKNGQSKVTSEIFTRPNKGEVMILSYVIHNKTDNDFPLEVNEAIKFIVEVDDKHDACEHLDKVKISAQMCNHTILNVYLDNAKFDARQFLTEGANSDNFDYDDSIKISRTRDEVAMRKKYNK